MTKLTYVIGLKRGEESFDLVIHCGNFVHVASDDDLSFLPSQFALSESSSVTASYTMIFGLQVRPSTKFISDAKVPFTDAFIFALINNTCMGRNHLVMFPAWHSTFTPACLLSQVF